MRRRARVLRENEWGLDAWVPLKITCVWIPGQAKRGVVVEGRAQHLTRYSKIKTSHLVSPTASKVMIFRGSSFLHLCPPPQHPLESSPDPGGQAFVPVTQQIEEGSKLSQGWLKLPVPRESKLELLLHDPDPAGLRKPQQAPPQPPFPALGLKIGWLRDL